MNSPTIACVVTTVGRPVHLDRLLRSLSEQTHAPADIIVVDQSSDDSTATVVDTWRDKLSVRRITSARGASLGRNTGLAALHDGHDIVCFPDDDVWLDSAALAGAADALTGDDTIGVVTGRGIYPTGHRTHRAPGDRQLFLTKANVRTNSIEWTCFFRAGFFRDVGGFDETLGVGNPTPWQSTAGLDLLLRSLGRGWKILFEPAIVMYETSDIGTPEDRPYRVKSRHYARGAGRVYRRHYPLPSLLGILLFQLCGAAYHLTRGRWCRTAWRLQMFAGLAEGMTGRLFHQVTRMEPLELREFRDTPPIPNIRP